MIDGIGRGTIPPQPAETQRPADAGKVPVGLARNLPAEALRTAAGGLVRTLAASPPVDGPRVAALRAGIAAGSYRPDPQAIAAAMLALEGRR